MSPIIIHHITYTFIHSLTYIIHAGMQIGTVIALPVSGWLISAGFLGGWPSVFYVFGALGIVWGIPWFLLTHDRPEKHPRISQAELSFIQGHQETVKKAEVEGYTDISMHHHVQSDTYIIA